MSPCFSHSSQSSQAASHAAPEGAWMAVWGAPGHCAYQPLPDTALRWPYVELAPGEDLASGHSEEDEAKTKITL